MTQLKAGLFWGIVGFIATSNGAPFIITLLLTLLGYLVTLDVVRVFKDFMKE